VEESTAVVAEKIKALTSTSSKIVVGSLKETRNLPKRAKQLYMANIPKKVRDRLVAGVKRF
jgi:hypothetical protein